MSGNDRRIDYVEFGVADIARAKAFYGTAFGWRFTDYGPQYCEFDDGRLKGGFTTLSPVTPGGALVVVYGDDLPALQKAVAAAGGLFLVLATRRTQVRRAADACNSPLRT